MRLFIAVNLPDNVKQYLRGLQKLLPEAKMSLAHDFHMTLQFLGDCEESVLPKIKRELAEVAFEPFESKLTQIGTFGGKNPRVVWVGTSVPRSFLETVKDIKKRMSNLRLGKESHNEEFAAHVTLARIRFISNPQSFLEDLGKKKIEPMPFSVKRFHLFESKLSSQGAVHTKLADFP